MTISMADIKRLIELGVNIAKENAHVAHTVVGEWVDFDTDAIEKEINYFLSKFDED